MIKNVSCNKYLFLSILLFGFVSSRPLQANAFSEELHPRRVPNPIRIVDSNEQSIIVELTADRPHIEAISQQHQTKILHNQTDSVGSASEHIPTYDTLPPDMTKNREAQSYHRFTIAGMAVMMKPGEPQIPVYGSLFGISSPDNVSLQILDAEFETMRGYHIPPAPPFPVNSGHSLDVQGAASAETNPTPATNGRDERLYARDAFYPGVLAALGHMGYLRDQPVAQAQWYPLQYNPVTGDVRFYHRIRARITWDIPPAQKRPPRYGSSAFENLLKAPL